MQHQMIRLTVALDEPGVTQQHAADLSMSDAAADPEMVGRTLQALSARVLGALDLPVPDYAGADKAEQDPAAEDKTPHDQDPAAPTLREHVKALFKLGREWADSPDANLARASRAILDAGRYLHEADVALTTAETAALAAEKGIPPLTQAREWDALMREAVRVIAEDERRV